MGNSLGCDSCTHVKENRCRSCDVHASLARVPSLHPAASRHRAALPAGPHARPFSPPPLLGRNELANKFTNNAWGGGPELKRRGVAPQAGSPGPQGGGPSGDRSRALPSPPPGSEVEENADDGGSALKLKKKCILKVQQSVLKETPETRKEPRSECGGQQQKANPRTPQFQENTNGHTMRTVQQGAVRTAQRGQEENKTVFGKVEEADRPTMSASDDNLQAELSREIDEIRSRCVPAYCLVACLALCVAFLDL